jgi:tetratricopeptide (TPR) repeat protein
LAPSNSLTVVAYFASQLFRLGCAELACAVEPEFLVGRVRVRKALMNIRVAPVLVGIAVCLTLLGGCASSTKLSDLWTSKSEEQPAVAPPSAAETTGSVVVPPAEPGPNGEPVAPLAQPGLLGDDPNDDLQVGKRYFRNNDFGAAENSFRSAAEKHPNDAEAWVGLAASYDRLHRFDLADRAYQQAIRLVGKTPEVLNNIGFSYMLRGDYNRAQKALREAQAKDPRNPYIMANMRLLEDSYRGGKAVQ